MELAAKHNPSADVVKMLFSVAGGKDDKKYQLLKLAAKNNSSADVATMLLKSSPNMPSSQKQDLLFSAAEHNPSGRIIKTEQIEPKIISNT